jgi:fructokinase
VIRPQMAAFLDHAKNNGAIIYYDVNFRASHKHEVMKLTPNILENLEYADIVRGSSEDFDILYKKTDADAIYRSQISFYTKNFILTQSSDPVELRAEGGIRKQYTVEKAVTVSTIGAGDNFNAGFIYGLIKYGITREMIMNGFSEQQWDQLIACGQQFSANVCKSIDNSIDAEFGNKMAQELKDL